MALGFVATHRYRVPCRREVSFNRNSVTRQSRYVMSQTNWIGAFIAVGFLAYIIARGQLPGYLQVLGLQQS
jgi:hypothetical protein